MESRLPNVGRCVVCGNIIDVDDGERVIAMEVPAIKVESITEEDARNAIARALRYDDAPESHTLASAYEDGEDIILHPACHDATSLPSIYDESVEPA
jgi:hypothetical protein